MPFSRPPKLYSSENITPNSSNKALTPIFKAVDDMVIRGWITHDERNTIVEYLPPTEMSLDEDENKAIHYLTNEQLSALKQYHESLINIEKRTRAQTRALDSLDMFFFSLYTGGLRISDLITLQWKQIDEAKGVVNKTMVKTRNRVSVPFRKEGKEILQRWKGKSKRFVFNCLPDDFNLDDKEELRRQINNKNRCLRIALQPIGEKIGLEEFNLTAHVARHTFATYALNKGINIHMISTVLGHSSVEVTGKVYAKFMPETIKQELEEKLTFDF